MRGLVLSFSRLSPVLLVSLLVLSTQLLWAQRKSPPEEIPSKLFNAPTQLAAVSEAQTLLHFTYRGLPLIFTQNQSQTAPWMRLSAPGDTGNYGPPLTFASTYGQAYHQTLNSADQLEYYGHHIPWAGSLIVRICKQAKVHPHITRVLTIVRPKF
jgi:hypothetical protein